jgi:bifunctional DNA-binding transcriptional regulator/antitoxin component of YhaV-PrlF toxin-antitoxin module
VPKALRLALGLKPGQPLEIRAADGRLEIEIAATPMLLKKRGKGLVAVPTA